MTWNWRLTLPALLGCVACLGAPAAEVKTGGNTQWIEDLGGAVIGRPVPPQPQHHAIGA